MNENPTKRRRFRFSLRTLFVVLTVLCCFLGYNLNWIRQRHEALAHLHIGSYFGPGTFVWNNVRMAPYLSGVPTRDAKPPWSLRLLGEAGVTTISVYGPDHAAIAENFRRLFPEALVSSAESPAPTAFERTQQARKQLDEMVRRLVQDVAQQNAAPDSPGKPVK